MTQLLGDGLVLRPARRSDLAQIAELLTLRGEEADAEDLHLIVDDPDAGIDGIAVVVDGDRVVSTATLLDEVLHVGAVALPAGQVELVATEPAYEGRGLVRSLMGWCHERSASRGHVVQVMVGIPYFYRQFGYEYAIPMPRSLAVDRSRLGPVAADFVVRRATSDDLGAMAVLQDAEQAGFAVRLPHTPACRRWLVARHGTLQWVVADGAGAIVATGRTTPPGEGVVLGEVAGSTTDGALALIAHAVAQGNGEAEVKERPGTVAGGAIAGVVVDEGDGNAYYVRVPDPVALLEALRPVLSARLIAAGLASEERGGLISGFRWHLRFALGPEGVGPMEGGGPMQGPSAAGGSGVAPDRFASLVFGPLGAVGLADREPDVYLGHQVQLMAALFPPLTADLLTFYLP